MEINRMKKASRMVNLVQKVTTDIETNNNVSVDLKGKEQRVYDRYL